MRARHLRSLLALALILSLALKYRATTEKTLVEGTFDMRAAVIGLTRTHGWIEEAASAAPRQSLLSFMHFAAPGCSRATIVAPVALNLEIVSLIGRVVAPDYGKRFIYIEHEAPVQSRIALYAQWMKHVVLSLAGLTRYLPVRTAVLVAEPPDCHASRDVDWRLIWERGQVWAGGLRSGQDRTGSRS
jgi:hypothetical protein